MKSINIQLPRGIEYNNFNKARLLDNILFTNIDDTLDYSHMVVWKSNNPQKAPEIYVPHICLLGNDIITYEWGVVGLEHPQCSTGQDYAVRFIPILTLNNMAYCLFINQFGQIQRINSVNINFFEKSILIVDPTYIRKLICEKIYEPDLYIYNSYKELERWNRSGCHYGEEKPKEIISI